MSSIAICVHKMHTVSRAIETICKHAKCSKEKDALMLCREDEVLEGGVVLNELISSGRLSSGDSLWLK
jgi:hypothetical protein